MTAPRGRPQQARLLPYLAAILVVLLAYVAYSRLMTRPGPQALPPLSPPPVAMTPAPAATPTVRPTPSPSPPLRVQLRAVPVGRPNPFVPLVSPQTPAPRAVARPVPPPLPPVPPPFFPEPGGETRPTPPAPGPTPSPQPVVPFRATGTVMLGGVRLAILQAGERTYFARVGDVVLGFRVVAVEPEVVRIQRGTFEHVFILREVEPQ